MKRSLKMSRWFVCAVAVCAGAVAFEDAGVRTAPVPLLEPVSLPGSRGQAGTETPEGAIRSRAVHVNLYPLPTPATAARAFEEDIELALFPDVTVRAVFDRFDTIGGSGTWRGHVSGVPMSSVELAYRDGLLIGSINTVSSAYEIRPASQDEQAGDGSRPLHLVAEVEAGSQLHGRDLLEAPPQPLTERQPPAAPTDAGDTVDVLAVYTPAALRQAGGDVAMDNLIALGIASTNAAYQRSGIAHQVRLVHKAAVPYSEANKSFQALSDLRVGAEGLASVPALRDQYGADLVILFANTTGFPFSGVAYISAEPTRGRADLGFSVVCAASAGCASVVVPHEVGHNMGAAHDWFEAGGFRSGFPYGYGHIDVANRWRTIMAYPDLCVSLGFNCTTLNYFSNPQVDYVPFCSDTVFNCDLLRSWLYPRAAIGVPEPAATSCRAGVIPASPCQADNRRLHNAAAPIVASYRPRR